MTAAVAASAVAAAAAFAHTPAPAGQNGAGGASGSGAARSSSAGTRVSGHASIRAIQQALGITADGVHGPETARAIRGFQRSRGLAVDGIAGPRTRAALGLAASAPGDGPGSASADATTATSTGAGGVPGTGADTATTTNGAVADATLARIAACESGGDPTAVSPDGRYRGKYQFTRATWRRIGGTGDPAQASEAEQDRLAAKLLAKHGTSPWPACG